MRALRAIFVATAVGTAACSLLLPFDGYDSAYGADASGLDGPAESSSGDAPPADASDAAPACVTPETPACDADIATDIANCGACGHRCSKPSGACTLGVCDVESAFWFPFVTPTGVALDDNYFYGVGGVAITGAEGGVARAMKAGSGGSTLALYTKDPRRVVVSRSGTDLYWTQAGGVATTPNNTQPDGGPNVAKSIVAGQSNPQSIAVDATYVFWVNPPPDGEVWRATLDGADAKAIVTHTDAMSAYGVAVDASYVYFTSNTQGGAVWRADKHADKAGQFAKLVDNQSFPSDIFVDAEAVYWTNGSLSDGAVMKLPLGATAPLSLAGKRVQPGGVFVRDPWVYWHETGATNRDILRAPKCGGAPLRLVVGQKVTDMAVEDKSVYWATGDAINRVAR